MSDTTKQPTILVKKSDGTSVRMTLSEFSEYKKQVATSVPAASVPQPIPPVQVSDDRVREKTAITETPKAKASVVVSDPLPIPATPVVEKKEEVTVSAAEEKKDGGESVHSGKEIMEAPAHELVEATSSLPAVVPEELPSHDTKHNDLPTLPGTRDDLLQKVLKKLSFEIRPELQGRVASLVQSRLKDIRNDAEVVEYASREEDRGGLGIGPEDAAMFLGAIKEVGNVAQKKSLPKQRPAIEKGIRSLPRPTPVSASGPTVPIEPVRQQGMPISASMGAPRPTSIPISPMHDAMPAIPRTATGRPLMHDMMPALPVQEKKRSVGPVEELRTLALADFRRLGKDTAARLPILLQKFTLLKKDSYLLFIEAREAWIMSPLYRTYEAVIRTALQQGKPITQILNEQQSEEQLTLEEFEALARVGRNIET